MITLGTGIGGAILEDGRVKRGKYGVAGEFGHMQVVPGGHRCPCGNRGCWEQYSSGNALVREARELAAAESPVAYGIIDRVGGQVGDITGPLITELARSGDAMCTELFHEVGSWLGVGLANLAAALDPSCFVVGGGVSAADRRTADRTRQGGVPAAAHGPRIPAGSPDREGGSWVPRRVWSVLRTWPGWWPAASGVPTGAGWSATSATSGRRTTCAGPSVSDGAGTAAPPNIHHTLRDAQRHAAHRRQPPPLRTPRAPAAPPATASPYW